jgi:4-hydroxy-3-methylbut-2-en-1-yl diphosphate reductase
MEEHGVGYSKTGLVAQMRANGNIWQQGDVTVRLAEAYGFCWGVERAVQVRLLLRLRFQKACACGMR